MKNSWHKEYGGMDGTQTRKLKEMEKENVQLKKVVANLSLDNAILKEVPGKNNLPDKKRRAVLQSIQALDEYPMPGYQTPKFYS
jgi:hypothetical protein